MRIILIGSNRNIQGGKAHTRPEDGVLDTLAAEENMELGRKDDIDQRSTMEQNSEQLAAQRYPVTRKAQIQVARYHERVPRKSYRPPPPRK